LFSTNGRRTTRAHAHGASQQAFFNGKTLVFYVHTQR